MHTATQLSCCLQFQPVKTAAADPLRRGVRVFQEDFTRISHFYDLQFLLLLFSAFPWRLPVLGLAGGSGFAAIPGVRGVRTGWVRSRKE